MKNFFQCIRPYTSPPIDGQLSRKRCELGRHREKYETVASKVRLSEVNERKVKNGVLVEEKTETKRRGYEMGTHLEFFLIEAPDVVC